MPLILALKEIYSVGASSARDKYCKSSSNREQSSLLQLVTETLKLAILNVLKNTSRVSA